MTTALVPVSDLEKMARALAGSKLFGIQNAEQALALMLVAQAEGLHPATAARDYHIIQGRPALKADAMMARYLSSGGKVQWHEHTDTEVAATFTHPSGGSLKIGWNMERARKAGLAGKDMWAKYPRQMLRARVISEGIRATNPGIAIGIYTPEEVGDMQRDPVKRGEPRDMGTIDAETGEIIQNPAAQEAKVKDATSAEAFAGAAPLGASPPAPAGLSPERAALRLTDAESIAGCKTEPELTALVKTMLKGAKGDAERIAWIREQGNAQDAALTEAFQQ